VPSPGRETVLHLPYGTSGGGSPTGSMLATDAPPDAQWLTEEVAAYVCERTTGPRQHGSASINTDRLRRNLLSSMPLCFNMFGHLNAYPDATARVLGKVLVQKITGIGPIRVEYAPPKARTALKDATGFDAYVPITTATGNGFLAIETKDTEPFSPKEYYKVPSYDDATNDRDGWFIEGCVEKAKQSTTNQLWRNTMLAQLTEQQYREDGIGAGQVIVLTARDDARAQDAVAGLNRCLTSPHDRLRHILLEDIVRAALCEPDLEYWAHLFAARYLSRA
jgi:hypothetical protein